MQLIAAILLCSQVCLFGVQQAAGTYTGYQGLLGLPADEFANLTAAEKEAEGRFAVWKTLLELQEKVIDWTTGPILSREDNSVSLLIAWVHTAKTPGC